MHKISLPFIIVLFSCALNAQQNYSFHHISVEDGLSQSSVICMHQDKKGLIWIGTADGLNKYDGTKFTYYKHDPVDTTTLSAATVLCIYEDENENLWLGTDGGGLNIFDTHTEKFTCYKNIPGDSNSISSNRVTAVLHDSGSRYLVATFSGGLNFFDANTKKFTALLKDSNNTNTISSNNIYRLLKTSDGKIWLGTRGGLDLLDAKSGRITSYKNIPDDEYSLPENKVQSLYEDLEHRIWIGTFNGAVCEFDRKTNKFIRYKEDNEIVSGGNESVNCLIEDSNNQLWIGYSGKGIKILNKKTGAIQTLKNEKGNPGSPSSDEILCFLNDRSNMLWTGTFGGGISLYDKTFGYFNKLNATINKNFSNKNVYSIYCSSKGTQWIGTNGGGLYKLNALNDTVANYTNDPLNKRSISNNNVWCIAESNTQTLWIGTQGGGINLFDETSNSFVHNHEDTIINSLKNIWSIFRDDENLMWIGTGSDGIYIYDAENKKPSVHNAELKNEKTLKGKGIYCITQSKDGLILIGTRNSGLHTYNKKSKLLKQFLHDSKDKYTISSNSIQCIYDQGNEFIWAGTNGGGLNLFDVKSEKFICFTEKDGLPNNVIYGILPDKSDNLWLSTNKGICKFTLKPSPAFFSNDTSAPKPLIRNYNSKDGLPSDEFNQGAYFKDTDGNLFFGSINGVATFNPDSIKENPFTPPVIITAFKIFEKNYLLDTTIFYKNFIRLNYKQNFISFEFAALNYLLPEKNNYAFMMEGLDKKYNYSGNRHYASYTNLDPGEYIFKVKASNNDGAWNENFASVKILITPPFWKTWWFKSLLILFIISSVWSFYKYRVSQIRKEEQKKTAFNKALAEVEMKALRAQMNPHFIFNSLNSINKFIVSKDQDAASDYLTRFSSLIRMVLDNSMHKEVSLDKDIETLELYMQMEQLRFEEGFEYEIAINEKLDPETVLIPPLLLQPFVENSIWHGLMPKGCGGKILIKINSADHTLNCMVEDNGIGRTSAGNITAAKKSVHQSLGMKVTEERIEILKQQKNTESKFAVTDLKDSIGNAIGTRVEISIPLEYSY